MSRYDFKLPDIGEGVTEGEVVGWHVKVGDTVKEDQPLADVMTDKATVTITCPKAGTVTATNGSPGQIIKVGAVLASFDLGGNAVVAAPAAPAKSEGPAATAVGDIKESLPGMGVMVQTAVARPSAPAVSAAPAASDSPAYTAPNGKVLATPATRKLARDLGVDLVRVPPTGTRGHVTKDDIRGYVARPSAPAPSAMVVAQAEAPAPQAIPSHPVASVSRAPVSITAAPSRGGEVLEERVPFAGVRKRIAERMSLSKNTAAHFTFVEECDVSALKAVRERMRPKAEAKGVKLTFLPFIVKATVAALRRFPILNTALDEATQELVYRKFYNIGVAAASEAGLVVPVVKGADRRSLLDLAKEIDRLGTDVKNGKQKVEDLQGSTFTITSLGAQGGLFATPIINFPEVGILGVHQIKQKPVVRDGQIVIGDVMLLSLSFDHRIVDGHVGAAFAYEIIRLLQDPDALLMEI